jgi:hypothetical protein
MSHSWTCTAARMKRGVASALLCAGLLGAVGPVQGQPAMKPGLWQIRQQMELDPAQQAQMEEMRKQMAAMPQAQRKQMEEMMSRQGASVDVAGGGMSSKVCVTAEDVARQSVPMEQRPDCKYDQSRSGARTNIQYVCTKPPSQGDIEITTLSPERYTMKMRGTGGAKGTKMAMQGEGQWLGADCGSVKPMPRPPAGAR